MSMPTARKLLVLMFALAKVEILETEKHAKVDKRNVLLNHEVSGNVVDTSEPTIGFHGRYRS